MDILDLTQNDCDEVLHLTQNEEEPVPGPSIQFTNNDDMFDEIFPLTSAATRADSGFSSGGSSGLSRNSSQSTNVDVEDDNIPVTRGRKKTAKAETRQIKKQKVATEKAQKAAVNEMNKIYKPGECMKHMYVELHPALRDAWYMADVPRELQASGSRVVAQTDLFDPRLIMWSRNVPVSLCSLDGQVQLTPKRERCTTALYVTPLEDIVEQIASHSLSQHIRGIKEMVQCELTVVVFGVKEYFKKSGRKTQSSRQKINEIEMEMAFTDLLVSADCDALVVNSANELALLILHFTKAIAEAPHKKAKRAAEDQAEFYMKGDNKKCVTVDKDGHGLSRLWQQMVAILPLSSLETARSVCAQYKSPLALYEALQSQNGVNSLADIGISRAAVPGSRARRLGPEFARKLNILLTADDGDMLVE